MKVILGAIGVLLALAFSASATPHYEQRAELFGPYIAYIGPVDAQAVHSYAQDAADAIDDLIEDNPVIEQVIFDLGKGRVILRPIEGRFIPYAMLHEVEQTLKARQLWVEHVVSTSHSGAMVVHVRDTHFRQTGGRSRYMALRKVPGDLDLLKTQLEAISDS